MHTLRVEKDTTRTHPDAMGLVRERVDKLVASILRLQGGHRPWGHLR